MAGFLKGGCRGRTRARWTNISFPFKIAMMGNLGYNFPKGAWVCQEPLDHLSDLHSIKSGWKYFYPQNTTFSCFSMLILDLSLQWELFTSTTFILFNLIDGRDWCRVYWWRVAHFDYFQKGWCREASSWECLCLMLFYQLTLLKG